MIAVGLRGNAVRLRKEKHKNDNGKMLSLVTIAGAGLYLIDAFSAPAPYLFEKDGQWEVRSRRSQ